MKNEAEASPAESIARPARRRMSMALVNFWLDAALLATIVFIGWVTAMLQFVFPAPTIADGWLLWGLSFDQWRDTQFVAICLFALLVLLHVMLHWNWVCSVISAQVLRVRQRPDDGMQTIYGVAFLILLLHVVAAGVIIALLTVQAPSR